MIVFFLVLILPANIYLQLYMQHRNQRENLIGMDMSHKQQIYDHCINNEINAFHQKFGGKCYCVYAKEYGEYLLIRTYLSWYPLKEIAWSTILILLYVMLVALGVIGIIRWYIDRKSETYHSWFGKD